MSILDVLNAPWAMLPSKKEEIDAIYTSHLRGEKVDLKGLEARIGRPLGNQRDFQMMDGKAVIPVEGVLSKRISLLHDVSGGTSTEKLSMMFDQALNDPQVKEIILHIDSPGGAVDGTKAFADQVAAARGQKPITAFIDGMAASAAYWIASAADSRYIRDTTAMVGSIGVIMTHVDKSQALANEGVKVTEITAGAYKAVGSQHAPLTEEALAVLKDRVDTLYTIFVDSVAANLGVSVDTVLSDMADGRVFIGMDAVNRGLVDGVATMNQLLSPSFRNPGSTAVVAESVPLEPQAHQEESMSIETTEKPAVAALDATAIQATERERIQGVLALSRPGCEALIQGLAFDGKTTPDQAAAAILAHQDKRTDAERLSLEASAPKPVTNAATPNGDEDPQAALRARWDSMNPAARSAFKNDFAAFAKGHDLRASLAAEGRVNHFSRTK